MGLAFSQTVRCIVFLMLPQLFSKRGRQTLLAYALILAITGPARNTANNMSIMSESLACGQEQLKVAVRQITDVIKRPFIAIKEAIKKVIKVVKDIVAKIKEIFLTIKKIVVGIARVIKSAFDFLAKIFNICSKKLGTPFERCIRVFDDSILDCQAKLGPLFSWLCAMAYVIQAVCYIVKPLDFICMLAHFINDSVVGVIMRKIRTFTRHIRAIFYVKIRFSHDFAFETTQSKTMKEVSANILAEIRERIRRFMQLFDVISAATSLFAFVIVLRVIYYRYKFLTADRYDNKYITREFREIDFRRAQMDRETVLPLNNRERLKFINVSSVRLVRSEKLHLFKALAILFSSYFQLATFMFFDYSLYWLLATIRYHGRYRSTVQAPRTVDLHVEGNGFLADLYRSFVKAFQPLGVKMDLDNIPCLPEPILPNFDTYTQIGFIALLCLLLAVFEPYGLRIRQVVMCYYHPDRAKVRAIWLYNHIMRQRSSFLKFARRQLKRKFYGQERIDKVTCKEYLRAKLNVKCLRFCLGLGSDNQNACVLCAQVFRDDIQPVQCSTPGCVGIFCEQCFVDLNNICTICLDPIQYGDLSDIDVEQDSSDDETSNKFKRRSLKKQEQNPSIASGRRTTADYRSDEGSVTSRYEVRQNPGFTKIVTGDLRERAGEGLTDSDSSDNYSHSDTSTDYSDSYQYSKDYSVKEKPLRTPFEDVEQQRIPDYVSMEIFHQDFQEIEEENSMRRVDEEIFLLKRKNSEQTSFNTDGYLSDDEMDANETTLLFKRKSY
ncbi:uncharacterized protein CBL_08340 [Carabus blaptoides fortunei]